MMLLKHDGSLTWSGAAAEQAGRTRATIELPIELLDEQSDLIDRVFAFAFDALGLQAIELRIRRPAAEGRNPVHLRSI
jgi:hypothetical protein